MNLHSSSGVRLADRLLLFRRKATTEVQSERRVDLHRHHIFVKVPFVSYLFFKQLWQAVDTSFTDLLIRLELRHALLCQYADARQPFNQAFNQTVVAAESCTFRPGLVILQVCP